MLKQLLAVFLEFPCAFCRRKASDTFCQYCWAQLSSCQLSDHERLRLQQNKSVFAWGRYDGQLKRAIALMKYERKPEIGNVIGQLLGQAWLASHVTQQKFTVIPIPLHRQKIKTRGFNQAEVIAQSFCQLTGYKLNTQALVRTRNTKAMYDLKSLAQRANNLQGAFCLGHKIPQSPVLLIDDIYTTGTTVAEAVKVLQRKQIKVKGVVVAAKAGTTNAI